MIEVTSIDHMGNDLTVVNAARVSFGKKREALGFVGIDGVMQPVLHDTDIKLIDYLAKHKHMSPFGHCFASFHVKAPVFVARQLVKHKFLRWNEISRRYVDDEPEFYEPEVWRGRSADKKQGSEGTVAAGADDGFVNHTCLRTYKELLSLGVAPEQARFALPQGMYTEWYWTGSLAAYARFYKQRIDDHAQWEIRQYAEEIGNLIEPLFPSCWSILTKYK